MHGNRRIEAFCETCKDVTQNEVTETDPGSCTCLHCGTTQALMVPID